VNQRLVKVALTGVVAAGVATAGAVTAGVATAGDGDAAGSPDAEENAIIVSALSTREREIPDPILDQAL